jgi:ferric-dicitrate binding protein FerR (iron transport regulator)
MSNDYLWDCSGEPDPEIERLEKTLGALRYRREYTPPDLELRIARRRWWPGAIAAAAVVVIAVWQLMWRPALSGDGWEVTEVSGAAQIGNRAATPSTRIGPGLVMRTGRDAKLLLRSADFGQIDIAPESELVVTTSAPAHQQFSLRRGLIHALIWAPPRRFVVETPSARAIDLGCEYSLSVDEHGNGLLDVQSGWVAFQFGGREVFVPAGATCRTHKLAGPGVPWFRDAPASFRDSLRKFEDTGAPAELASLLSAARPPDGLTLWHLLRRVSPAQRGAVFDRFRELTPLPAEVNRGQVLAGDANALDLCWNALHLEKTEWWREWKRDWKP